VCGVGIAFGYKKNYSYSSVMFSHVLLIVRIALFGNCGLQVKTELKITGIWFAKDKRRMDELNWGGVVTKVKSLLSAWSGRRLTIIGKTNIVRAQIQPLISFVAGSQQLPEKYDIILTRVIFAFIWGGSDKATRALCYQRQNHGGLNVSNFRARAIAIQSNWIQRAKNGNGIFKQIFTYRDIDWDEPGSYDTPFPRLSEDEYCNICLNSWTENLRLLTFKTSSLIWPHVNKHLRPAVLGKSWTSEAKDEARRC
jgi:hypothetical protein